MNKLNNCLTLVNLLQTQGPLSLEEITERYKEYSPNEEELGRRQFFRYKATIEESMPCKLEYRNKKYSLVWDLNITGDTKNGGLWGKLLAQAEVADMSNLMAEMSNKVALLQPPSGEENLRIVLMAMKKGKGLHGTYTARIGDEPKTRIWVPAFVALWDSRWYMIAECTKHPGSLAVYALERFSYLAMTKDKHPSPTKNKTAEKYFKDQYGVFGPDFNKPKDAVEIRLKVTNMQLKYMMMPLFHPSMKIIEEGERYSLVSLKVVPNRNLYQKLLSFGSEVEVIYPQSVRYTIAEMANSIIELYK